MCVIDYRMTHNCPPISLQKGFGDEGEGDKIPSFDILSCSTVETMESFVLNGDEEKVQIFWRLLENYCYYYYYH